MVFYSNKIKDNVTVSDSECYKYIRKSSGKSNFFVCFHDVNGNKQTKKVNKEEFDELMCRSVEYR